MELVAWVILVTFIEVNKTLGELFRGDQLLNEEYIKYILTIAEKLVNKQYNVQEYVSTRYYYNDITIEFK